MIEYVVEVPLDENDKNRAYKYPFFASNILASEVDDVVWKMFNLPKYKPDRIPTRIRPTEFISDQLNYLHDNEAENEYQ